jgi:hypothetical protein
MIPEAQHTGEKDDSYHSSDAIRPHAARELDQRRRDALLQVDNANFSSVFLDHLFSPACIDIVIRSWFHFKVCAVAGCGFFTDA